jgi:hypothetical protein
MKFLSTSFATGFCSLALVNLALGAGYVTQFDSPPFNGPDTTVVGVDGWTLNDTNQDIAAILMNAITPGSPGLAFGDGDFAPPASGNTTIGLTNSYTEFVAGTKATFSFRLIDSSSGTFADRDGFGFSIQSGTDSIEILFESIDDTLPANNGASWKVGHSVNGGSTTYFPASIGLEDNSVYTFSLSITASGANSNVGINISGASDSFIAPISPTASASSFSFLWRDQGAAGFDSSYLLVDNLSVVPEPSAMALLAAAGLGFSVRRRRI